MSDVCDTYPNEGPLWPCGCLVGSPYCNCGDPSDPLQAQEVADVHADLAADGCWPGGAA